MKKSIHALSVCLSIAVLLLCGCRKSGRNVEPSVQPVQNQSEGTFGSFLKNAEKETYQEGTEKIQEKQMNIYCPESVYKPRTDVAYGTVKHETYYSNTCRMERGYNILLPASYDGTKKFPVVYFQHGIFGDEYSITNDPNNSVKEITANLVADGKAKEMIIVFGNMYAADDPSMKPGFDANAVKPYDNFLNELVNDLMPYIESHYSVLTGRQNTAVCGFSMGGRESLYIGLNRPDLFDYVGAISPAPGLVPGKDKYMVHEGSMQEADVRFDNDKPIPSVVMICCGTTDSVVGQFPKLYHQLFQNNGINHTWFEVMGADHDNRAIRAGLYYFIQQIF